MNKNVGKHWYNNGKVQTMTFKCPKGFVPGALPVKNKEEVVRKRKQTCLAKYGDENYNNLEKNKQTCLNKYGCEYSSQVPEIKQKVKNTMIANYGEDYGKILINKSLITLQERTDNKELTNTSQLAATRQKVKDTCLKKYGQASYLGCSDYLEKTRQTCLEKYGVSNVSQLPEIASKKHKNILVDGLNLDSQWELAVYNFCKLNNLSIERNVPFDYISEGKAHRTFIDFKINGYLVEVKGTHLLHGVFDNQQLKEKIKIWQKNDVIIVTSDNNYTD